MIPVLAIVGLLAVGEPQPPPREERTVVKIALTSPAFREGGSIPEAHTCDGPDRSPALHWDRPPDGARSLALLCEDPDAPTGLWVHWVIWGIPSDSTSLSEGVAMQKTLPNHARQGTNDFRKIGYGGPCPPRGKAHRYCFKLFALDCALDLAPGATRKQVLEAMTGHIVGEGELMGRYARKP